MTVVEFPWSGILSHPTTWLSHSGLNSSAQWTSGTFTKDPRPGSMRKLPAAQGQDICQELGTTLAQWTNATFTKDSRPASICPGNCETKYLLKEAPTAAHGHQS
jgi:hypothetical protein